MVSGVPQSTKPTSLASMFNPLAYSPPSNLVQAVKFLICRTLARALLSWTMLVVVPFTASK